VTRRHAPRRSRKLLVVACALAAAFAAPFLSSPLVLDDVVHRVMLERRIPDPHWGALELYDFLGGPGRDIPRLRDLGAVPWFAGEDLSLRFFRPLSSATLALDVQLFGRRLVPVRIHSLLWLFASIVLVAALHDRLLTRRTAPLATFISAVAAAHAMPVLWLAARHTVVATTWSLAAIYFHVRARADEWAPGRVLASIAFAVALLAGEMALGTLAVLIAWEAIGRRTPPTAFVRVLLPFFVLSAVYLALYVGLGYGARGSGGYAAISPSIATFSMGLRHWLILLGELAVGAPSDPSGSASTAVQWIAAGGSAIAVAIVAAMVRLSRAWIAPREMTALIWMAVAAAAAAAPGALAPIGGRVLTLALLPASGVAAIAILGGVNVLRSGTLSHSRKWLGGAALTALAFGHLVTGPLVRIGAGVELARIGRDQYRIASSVPPCEGGIAIVAAGDPTVSTYVAPTLLLGDRPIQDMHTLSMAAVDHRLERVAEASFDLVVLRNGREPDLWERLYRNTPIAAGDRVTVKSFDAAVREVENGWPTRVRFTFRAPLESGAVCFLQWRHARLEHVPLPTVGGAVAIPHERGTLGW
jgi:hypothetical protein